MKEIIRKIKLSRYTKCELYLLSELDGCELKEQEIDNDLLFYGKGKKFIFCYFKHMDCISINRELVYYINTKYKLYMDDFSGFMLKTVNNYYNLSVNRCLYDNDMTNTNLYKKIKHTESTTYKKF